MILVFMGIYRKTFFATDRLYMRFLSCNATLPICNILSWAMDGMPGNLVRLFSLTANFFMYTCTYLLIGTFTSYFARYLEEKGGKPRQPLRIAWNFISLAIFVMIATQFNHMYYALDPYNEYRRGSKYWLSVTIGIPCFMPCLKNIID